MLDHIEGFSKVYKAEVEVAYVLLFEELFVGYIGVSVA